LTIGVPDAEMAPVALPGHRLVLNGRGREAIRLSALGSGFAVLLALPVVIPLTIVVEIVYPTLRAHIEYLLAAVVAGLIISESSNKSRFGGLLAFLLSTALGALTLDLSPDAPLSAGGMLAPIFAGLFGAPMLIDAMAGNGIPRQQDARIHASKRRISVTVFAGTTSGALVGYLPGISAAIAAVAVLFVLPGGVDKRGYVVATSGVDTSNAIFALFALATIGQPRSGVMVAFEEASAPLELPILVLSVVIAGGIATVLVVVIGDLYLRVVRGINHVYIAAVVLCLLVVLSFLFAGAIGIVVFVVATLIGFVPVRLHAYRVHLMGVLMGPIIFGF